MAEPSDRSWRTTVKRRLTIASVAFALWSVAIEARLVYLQVIEHADLVAYAESQQSRTIELPPRRGDIFDRNGELLAYSVDADTITAFPSSISTPEATATALCDALYKKCTARDRAALLEKLTSRDAQGALRHFAYIKRRVTPQEANRVDALKLEGVGFIPESRRYYPNSELASHVLGFVGDGGRGGIEARFDELVGGEPGNMLVQVDARGRPFVSHLDKAPKSGASLELTIDKNLQHVAERELSAGVTAAGADGGAVIVMDPFSGELLVVASYPTYNPNVYNKFDEQVRRNRAVQDLIEPGSTFKVVTAGAALEEGVVEPGDLINTSPGVIRIGSRVIDEAKGHNYGTLSFEDVIVKSSNVGAIRVGLRLGPERLSSYVSRFGFGRRLSPHFRGESAGIWDPSNLTDGGVASVSMGYQVSVTPLQIATAVSSVANGGELVEPHLVRAVIRNGVRVPVQRRVLGRTVGAETAKELTAMMEAVVARGTAKNAQVPGYTIAGKTGTAAKVLPGGGYSTSDYNVSFVGFAPSREPRFVIMVVVDTPRRMSAYGGTVAAPIFQKIAEAALRQYGVPPSLHRPAPVLIARRGDDVREQTVAGPARSPEIVTVARGTSGEPDVMPDLAGLSARDAVRLLVQLGLTPRLQGTGYVVNQRPAAGTLLDVADTATVWLDRRPRPDPAATEHMPSRVDAPGVPRSRP